MDIFKKESSFHNLFDSATKITTPTLGLAFVRPPLLSRRTLPPLPLPHRLNRVAIAFSSSLRPRNSPSIYEPRALAEKPSSSRNSRNSNNSSHPP